MHDNEKTKKKIKRIFENIIFVKVGRDNFYIIIYRFLSIIV